jgi:hypothetical protein
MNMNVSRCEIQLNGEGDSDDGDILGGAFSSGMIIIILCVD